MRIDTAAGVIPAMRLAWPMERLSRTLVGDLMALNGLPGLAEVAMQSGHHAARTIARNVSVASFVSRS